MIRFYVPSHLELWVSKWYMSMNVYEPHEIDEYVIAENEGVLLLEKPSPSHAYTNGQLKIICLDTRCNKYKRKKHFFHEICHILRHDGNQSDIRASFRFMQEIDAQNFVKYALLPFHMLRKIDFKQPYLVESVSELFSVSYEFAEFRLQQIRNNILSNLQSRNMYFENVI